MVGRDVVTIWGSFQGLWGNWLDPADLESAVEINM